MISISAIVFKFCLIVGVSGRRPNIIFFILDDLGWNDVGFHGSSEIPTPNIDALAYNGVIFDRHYSQQCCTPSRASLLTGQYPFRFGYQGLPLRTYDARTLDQSLRTLPSELKKLGYRTHIVGKWHLGHARISSTPLAFGFDTHYGYYNGFVGYFNHTITEAGIHGIDFYDNLTPVNAEGKYMTDVLTERTLQIIDLHPKEQPLFLSINHLAAHTGLGHDLNGNTYLEVANITETNIKYGYITDPTRRMLADVMERADASLGKITTKLKEVGMLDDSILIFISDNGAPTYGLHATTSSNFPLRGAKTSLFEGGIRVPAAMYYSKIVNKGRVYKNIFHISDWVATLYAAAGGDDSVFSDIDGINHWSNLLNDSQLIPRKEMLVNIDQQLGHYSYISQNGKYKIITSLTQNYTDYSGEIGQDTPNYILSVINSPTNQALTNPKDEQIEEFHKIRTLSKLDNCRTNKPYPNCMNWCLFNLQEDPCETTDISEFMPDVLGDMVTKLNFYRRHFVEQPVAVFDNKADPRFCNGFWFPWLDGEDGCYYTRTNWELPSKRLHFSSPNIWILFILSLIVLYYAVLYVIYYTRRQKKLQKKNTHLF